MRSALLAPAVTLSLALAAGAAHAQAVPTASGREDELSTAQQIDAWVKSAPPAAAAASPARAPLVVSSSDPSPWADAEGGSTFTRRLIGPPLPYGASPLARTIADGQVHGEVGAEVGTLGYGGYAVASGKVAKDVYMQIGVSDYEASGKARRYRGGYGYGYPGYGAGGFAPGGYGGYGAGGYGGYAPGGGRSLSISAAWLPGHDAPDEPWRKPAPPTTPAY